MPESLLHSNHPGPLLPLPGRNPFLLQEQAVIGRDADIQKMKHWVKEHSRQDTFMLLVEGAAGVGKTVFISRLISEINEPSVFSLYGKFPDAPVKTPFLALKQCIHHWLDQLLVLKDEAYEILKQNVREAVHPHEGVLIAVFEELEILFGKKGFLATDWMADPQQERQRFTYYFYKLLKANHDSGFKTIFFLDDLQWADPATLYLIHNFLNFYQIPGLIIIASVRPQPAERNARLIRKIQALQKVKSFSLKPLTQDELVKLLPSEWRLSEKEQKAFPEYLMQESGGVPFDALQIISFIVQERLIISTRGGFHLVRWDKLPRVRHDHNASSLIMKELQGLSLLSVQLLQLASCMGYYFSCERLAILCRLKPETFRQGLDELTGRKIIIIQEEICYFVHDHFFTAAQALLLPEDKKRIHAEVGRYLVKSGALDPQHPEFFDCVSQLNSAGKSDNLFSEDALAVINISAAMLAQKKSAFDKSLEYYKIAESHLFSLPQDGMMLLPDYVPVYSWLPHPLLRKRVFRLCRLGIAEGEFLVQNFILADQGLSCILEQEKDPRMRLKAYTIRMKIFIASLSQKEIPFSFRDGMAVIEALLREYGIYLPQSSEEFRKQMEEAYCELLELLPPEDIEGLENRGISEDLEFHDLIHLIVHSLSFIFFVNIEKSKYLAVKSLLLCLRKGFTPGTPSIFASSVWTLAAIDNDYGYAYRLGQLGLEMVEKEPYQEFRHSVYHLATLNFFNWKHHYRETSAKLDVAVKLSLACGDLNYSVFCHTNARLIDLFRGVPLHQLKKEAFRPIGQTATLNFIKRSHIAFVVYMTGEKPGLEEGRFKFSKVFKQQVYENLNGTYHFSFVQEMLYLHAGLYQKALEAAGFCEKNRVLYEAFPIGLEHDFYYCLLLISVSEEKGGLDEETISHLKKRLDRISKLASMGSGNYLHKQKILEAELAKFHPKIMDAVSLYEEAIEESLRQGFIHLAALAAERCGEYLLRKKKAGLGGVYLTDAFDYYRKWGAQAKLDQLVQRYPEVQFKKDPHALFSEPQPQNGQEVIKLELVQSAIKLSQELYVSDVINRVLHICREQTRAAQAVFLLRQQFNWQMVASLDEDGMRILHKNLPVEHSDSPFKTLYDSLKLNEITYVPKVNERPELRESEYLRQKEVGSFMVIPLERHQEKLGLIYLENVNPEVVEQHNLLPWAELLRTQTGIALSNALLYENQVKLNEELRRQEEKRIQAVVETQEKERKRVAAELHDHLGQILSLTKLNLSRLEDSLEGQFKLYEETCKLLDESCSELRRIAHDMMPPDFTAKTLQLTLDNLFRNYLLAAGIKYQFNHHQLPEEIPIAIKFNIYRIAQEIIHNIIKHAGAKKVTIELSAEDNNLQMMIEDDGKGFDTCFRTDGLGLKSLYTRASLLKGRLEIDSIINRGSVFHIYIPFP